MAWLLLCLIFSLISEFQAGSLFEDFIGNAQVFFHSFALIMIVLLESPLPSFLKSFKCYFRSSILILINTVLKLWNKQRFCSFVYGYYTCIYYVSPFSGGEEWKIVADQLGFEDAYIRWIDNRFKNPVELILSCSGLRVGKLYDVLVECGFPLLADLL